jgi:predicted DNA-binding protein
MPTVRYSSVNQFISSLRFDRLLVEPASRADALNPSRHAKCSDARYMYHEVREPPMFMLRLPGRSRSFYAREAILLHLDDFEDYHLARWRLSRKASRVSLEELERQLSATR